MNSMNLGEEMERGCEKCEGGRCACCTIGVDEMWIDPADDGIIPADYEREWEDDWDD